MRNFLFKILSILTAAVCMITLFACDEPSKEPERIKETIASTLSDKSVLTDDKPQTDTFVTTDITEPVTDTDIGTETDTETITETDTEPITETDAEPITETETEPITETETEAVTEKETEPVTEKETVKETESADNMESLEKLSADIAVCYGRYGVKADKKIKSLIDKIRKFDAGAANKWDHIMCAWKEADKTLINYNVLPDGLCNTDELCIVVLGYQLNSDGSMKAELESRLNVALSSAKKYPEAYVVCTGGGTAANNPNATESGVMAKWLIKNGISENRVITENKSTTTAQNIMFTLDILSEKYPGVTQIAVVSSDYHIICGVTLFQAESIFRADDPDNKKYTVVSNAACGMPGKALSEMYIPSSVIELTGDVETSKLIYYNDYKVPKL